MHRSLFLIAVTCLATCSSVFAQDAENGRFLAERWCSSCHALPGQYAKTDRPRSFEAIANLKNVNSKMIVSFLQMPHAVMPNLPIRRAQMEDIAAYIVQMKK